VVLRRRCPSGTSARMAKAVLMGKPRRTHFQMLRSFAWADLFTFGNACCGTVSLFLCLYYLTMGQPVVSVGDFPLTAARVGL